MTPTATRPPGRLMLLIVAAVIWGLDQLTKMIVVQNMALGEVIAPIPALAPYFTFTHTTNTGAAFGLFPDAGWIFVVVAVVVIAAILFYYDQLPTHHRLVRVALGLQLGGAVGNLTDRLTRGAVVDFLDFKVWPVFNIADSSIVVGVAILAYYLLQDDHARAPSTVQPSTSSPGGSEGRGES